MQTILSEMKKYEPQLLAFRRYLHEHAETGLSLPYTRAFLKERLLTLGYTPKDCNGGLLVSVGKPDKAKGAFLLRADSDALPIQEKTGKDFACKTGNMHACGHDLHATMLYGAAILLKAREKSLKREIRLLFQFGEEILEGAKRTLQSGKIDGVTGGAMLHATVGQALPTGTAIFGGVGVIAPCADFFKVRIHGSSSHGATPDKGVDALQTAAHAIVALQSLSTRETGLNAPALLTIGKCEAGSVANAIADTAVFEGTLRAYDEITQNRMKVRLAETVRAVAKAFRAKAEIRFTSGCPTLLNDEALRERSIALAKTVLGEKRVLCVAGSRGGGSEDFAYFSHEFPCVMIAISAGEPKDGYIYPLHHPKTDFDERVLPYGAALYAGIALNES